MKIYLVSTQSVLEHYFCSSSSDFFQMQQQRFFYIFETWRIQNSLNFSPADKLRKVFIVSFQNSTWPWWKRWIIYKDNIESIKLLTLFDSETIDLNLFLRQRVPWPKQYFDTLSISGEKIEKMSGWTRKKMLRLLIS